MTTVSLAVKLADVLLNLLV